MFTTEQPWFHFLTHCIVLEENCETDYKVMYWFLRGGSHWNGIICSNLRDEWIKSDQVNVIYIAHNHIASMGFTICTVNDILCPYTLDLSEENLFPMLRKKIPSPTKEGSFSQDGQTLSICRMNGKQQQIHYLEVALTEYLICIM